MFHFSGSVGCLRVYMCLLCGKQQSCNVSKSSKALYSSIFLFNYMKCQRNTVKNIFCQIQYNSALIQIHTRSLNTNHRFTDRNDPHLYYIFFISQCVTDVTDIFNNSEFISPTILFHRHMVISRKHLFTPCKKIILGGGKTESD